MASSFVFDPYGPRVHADPFPLYKVLRDEHPAYYSEPGGFWVLSRYADVAGAVLDTDTFSSAHGNIIDDSPLRAGATLGTTDPPRHDQLRKLVQSAFLHSNVQKMEQPAREQARAILEDARARGGLDLVNELATPVTTGILARLLGLPTENLSELKRWVSDSLRRDPVTRKSPPLADEARRKLTALTEAVIAERRSSPTDDLISGLIEARVDGEALAEREILMTSRTLLAAGVESTVSFFGNLALNLMCFPEARRRVIAEPDRMGDAIEESLRYNTSAQRFSRTLTRDFEIHGQRLRAGDKVMVVFGSANRDERKFLEADRYDIDRRPTDHLGFGHGKHYCIGAGFGRLLTRVMAEELLRTVPDYDIVGELDWLPSPTFRSMVSFPVGF
ncbi:MAG TPA: cytochrome P450 [Vicinamibacteria bacterium]|nr:cytochrome P450 [Vicinamibacteria bacterium]